MPSRRNKLCSDVHGFKHGDNDFIGRGIVPRARFADFYPGDERRAGVASLENSLSDIRVVYLGGSINPISKIWPKFVHRGTVLRSYLTEIRTKHCALESRFSGI